MCDLCENANQVAHDILLSQLSYEVMLAEEEAGLTAGNTRRPMSKDERKAKVRFKEISELEEKFLDRVTPILERLTGLSKEVILAALPLRNGFRDISPRDLVDTIDELTANQPEEIRKAIADAIPEIEAALLETYAASSAVVIGEAKRQGVEARVSPLNPADDKFYAQAKNAALEPFRRVLTGVQDRVADPKNLTGYITDDTIVGMLSEITTDKAIDQARQASHQAIGSGRMDTFERLPGATYYASEILDERACPSCSAVDGRDYDNLPDARRDYPDGPMARCDGGSRCRGTLVAVYNI